MTTAEYRVVHSDCAYTATNMSDDDILVVDLTMETDDESSMMMSVDTISFVGVSEYMLVYNDLREEEKKKMKVANALERKRQQQLTNEMNVALAIQEALDIKEGACYVKQPPGFTESKNKDMRPKYPSGCDARHVVKEVSEKDETIAEKVAEKEDEMDDKIGTAIFINQWMNNLPSSSTNKDV
jgi:hypothetical protein